MFLKLLAGLTWAVGGLCFMGGAPDYTCRDPSVFHTQKINATHEGIIMPRGGASNPFALKTDSNTFKPGQRITVTLYTKDPSKRLKGFFIQAVQADIDMRDMRRRAFGTFTNTTAGERPSVCQSGGNENVGGITHTSNKANTVVRVTWIAPKEQSPGSIQFLATGVLEYVTYWTNIRSSVLHSRDYTPVKGDNTSARFLTPTAAWYQWLQYLSSINAQLQNSITDTQRKSSNDTLPDSKTDAQRKSSNDTSNATKSTGNVKS